LLLLIGVYRWWRWCRRRRSCTVLGRQRDCSERQWCRAGEIDLFVLTVRSGWKVLLGDSLLCLIGRRCRRPFLPRCAAVFLIVVAIVRIIAFCLVFPIRSLPVRILIEKVVRVHIFDDGGKFFCGLGKVLRTCYSSHHCCLAGVLFQFCQRLFQQTGDVVFQTRFVPKAREILCVESRTLLPCVLQRRREGCPCQQQSSQWHVIVIIIIDASTPVSRGIVIFLQLFTTVAVSK
jgi:hypothetical protein